MGHIWAMAHRWLRHVTHMNEPGQRLLWMSHGAQMIEPCRTYEWGTGHSCYTCEWALPKDFYEWVMAHTWMSHRAQINESCHTYERALSETSMNECHDSSICVPWLLKKSPWTESWLKYISGGATWFIWVPRLIHMCAMTPQEKSVTQSWLRCILEYATWFI